jgi:cobalt transporter subunit CbtB
MSEVKVLQQQTKSDAQPLSQRLAAAVFGSLLGAFILMGVGFANADLVHNAAHDSRHANSFPCH